LTIDVYYGRRYNFYNGFAVAYQNDLKNDWALTEKNFYMLLRILIFYPHVSSQKQTFAKK